MLIWLIPLIILVLSLTVAVVTVRPHFDKLRMLDVGTLPQAKTEAVKDKIMKDRLERVSVENIQRTKKVISPIISKIRRLYTTLHDKIIALENHYQKLRRAESKQVKVTSKEQIDNLMAEAKELAREGALEEAEKRYIEIISDNQKFADAYEELGHLYIEMKQKEQARQTFEYVLKMDANDASILTALGEIDMMEKKFDDAKDHFGQAIKLRPKNPKYLDFYIESAVVTKDKKSAKEGIAKLTEVNPDNKKIDEFKQRVKEI